MGVKDHGEYYEVSGDWFQVDGLATETDKNRI